MKTQTMKTQIKLLPEMLQPYRECIIDRGIMAVNNTAVIFDYDTEKSEMYIDLIVTDPKHRGNGEGKFILEHICNQADSTNTILKLVPDNSFNTTGFIDTKSFRSIFYKMASKSKNGLSKKLLTQWYERLGFVKQSDSNTMIRMPKN